MASDRPPHRFPRFDDLEKVRLHRKQRVAAALRLFGRFGFDVGGSGQITARDPELLDQVWINPPGRRLTEIRVKDLIRVGDDPFQLHATRPDVVSVATARSPHGQTWSAHRRLLDPLTQDACAFYDDHVVVDDTSRVAAALGDRKAAILGHHGLLTVGRTVDEAAWWLITMERTCQAQLLAESVGSAVPIDHDLAKETFGQVGHYRTGWIAFQPLYDWIVAAQPDLLET